jgi:glycosyltransferase involved in cell wall biosynthesis
MKVCMLVRKSFFRDGRVRREALSVASGGHRVTVVCPQDRQIPRPPDHWEGPVHVLHVPLTNALNDLRSAARSVVGDARRSLLQWRQRLYRVAVRSWRRLRKRLPGGGREMPPPLRILLWLAGPLLLAFGAVRAAVRLARRRGGPSRTPPPPSDGRRWLGRAAGCLAAPLFAGGTIAALLTLWPIPLALRLGRGLCRLVYLLLDSRAFVALRHSRLSWMYSYVRQFLPVVAGLRADVYHAHDLNTLRLAVAAADRAGAAVVYDSHELEYGRYAPNWTWFDWWFFRREERVLIRRIDALITVNDRIAEWLRRRYHPRRLVVVANSPRFPEHMPSIEEVGDWRATLGVGDRKLIIYVGGLTGGRGLPTMLDVMQRLGDGYLFALFGPAGYIHGRVTYDQMIEQRRLGDRVRIMGSIPEDHILTTLAQADCTVVLTEDSSLSHYYSLPNKLFQGAFARVPIVASRLPCTADVVNRFHLGLIVDPMDPDDVADAIRCICHQTHDFASDPKLLEALKAEFGWAVNERRLLGIYEQVQQERRAAAAQRRRPPA